MGYVGKSFRTSPCIENGKICRASKSRRKGVFGGCGMKNSE
jgi:hypothetical protein